VFYTKLYHDFSTSYLYIFEALIWEGFCLGGWKKDSQDSLNSAFV